MCINILAEAAIITDGRFGQRSNFSLVSYFSCPSPSTIRNLSSCILYASSSCGYGCAGNVDISCYGKTDCNKKTEN